MSRLLMIDDETSFCEFLAGCLKPDGFTVTVAHGGMEGLQRALRGDVKYDLIVLGTMLPDMSGFAVLQRIRASLDTPVLMLAARYDEVDRIVGFETGVEDFLIKPFNPRELVARVRAVLLRAGIRSGGEAGSAVPGRIVVGDVELDTGARLVRRDGERLELTSVEYDFLEMLLRAAGRVVTREQLSESILGRALSAYDRSVDVHLSSLRRKLGHKLDGIERIKSVRGVGYLYARPAQSMEKAAMP